MPEAWQGTITLNTLGVAGTSCNLAMSSQLHVAHTHTHVHAMNNISAKELNKRLCLEHNQICKPGY